MQKFKFRLDSVLRLRAAQLAVEREKLAAALAEVARIEQMIASLTAERAAAIAFVQDQSGATSTELRALAAYLVGFETRVAHSRAMLQTALQRVVEQRQRVMAADRDERLLLKLKEKRYREWQTEFDRELEALAQESWNVVHFKSSF